MLTLFCAANAAGAEFSLNSTGILIKGEINKGDYRRLTKFITSTPDGLAKFLTLVTLDSTGGDVIEAMKIATLFEKSYATVLVDAYSQCYSSCFLIWASGSERLLHNNGKLGVHRMTLADYNSQLTKAEATIAPFSQGVAQYLLKQGIPRRIVDKMNETSSSDIFIITNGWLIVEDLINSITYRPILIDMAQKKCGPDPGVEAMKTGIKWDKQTYSNWLICVGEIKTENQLNDLDKIDKLLKDGRLH